MAVENAPSTIVGKTIDLSGRLLSTLPPAFLLLVVVNVGFLALVMWFINAQMAYRTALVAKLLDRFMEIALQHSPPK